MKNTKKLLALAIAAMALIATSCDKNDDDDNNGNPNGDQPVAEEQILFGSDSTQLGNGNAAFRIKKNHTIKKGTYTMVGWIYVESGATLTIEKGTVIKGSMKTHEGLNMGAGAALIIERGAKIIAEGTASEPIVFTSAKPVNERQPADWGGIIICGKAKNNGTEMTIEGGVGSKHGGDDDNDNSGVLKYVRLEFGGYPFAPNAEINGLTLGSVGRGTTIDHVQVSYCGDDSFEFFGGTVNAKHLIAYHGWDDDFDTDNGYSGKLQFLLSVRDPKIADVSNSNTFESDNNSNGTAVDPYTSCVFSNVTAIGPKQDPNFVNNPSYIDGYGWGGAVANGSQISGGIFQSAMQIRRNSHLNCFNSVFVGYPVGLIIENDKGSTTQTAATNNVLKIKNVFFGGMDSVGADANSTTGVWTGDFSKTYFLKAELKNQTVATIAELGLNQVNSKSANPNYGPTANSILLNKAEFTDDYLKDSWFEQVTYVGAFKSDAAADNWTAGWGNFDPRATAY